MFGRYRLSSQDFDELIDAYNIYEWEGRLFEHIIMMILGYDITSIGLESTVNELVIIRVGSYKTQMIVHLNHLCIGEIDDSSNDIRSNFCSNFMTIKREYPLPSGVG